MQLEGTPGDYVLRIEPMEYFYNIDSQLQLTDIDEIATTFEIGSTYKQINIENNLGTTGAITFPAQFTNGITAGSITSGTSTLTFGTPPLIPPTVGDYVWTWDSFEVFKVITVGSGTLTTDRDAGWTVTNKPWFIGTYQQIKAAQAWVNGGASATVGNCIGEVLDLNNKIVTEIEKHGDQTMQHYPSGGLNRGISAGADRDTLSFLLCNLSTLKTIEYPYFLTSTSGPQYYRHAFNGHLTNHHKILGNALRIKYDCSIIAPHFSEASGYLLTYPNLSLAKPTRVHEFDYFLSFTDIKTIIQNPSQTIELEMGGEIKKCWIQEIEFDINTKKTHFKLIENL